MFLAEFTDDARSRHQGGDLVDTVVSPAAAAEAVNPCRRAPVSSAAAATVLALAVEVSLL